MVTTKKVGRPKKFDTDEALLAAVNVFWKKGYEGASLKDLGAAMGIEAPSLYATFGDKKSLFLKAIERYATQDGCAPLVVFEEEPDLKTAVRQFFTEAINYATCHESGARGCFLGSSVVTSVGNVEGIEAFLERAIDEAEQRIAKRFEKEKELGHLPADFPSLARAALMFDLRQGFVFRARAGVAPESMQDDLDYRVAMVVA